MRRLWPRSLAGQLILLLLLALVLAQGISLLIFADERRLALRAAGRDEVLGRTATIARLLAKTPPALHEAVLDAASTRRLRFWLAAESAVDGAEDGHHGNRLARRLRSLLEAENAPVLVDIRGRSEFWEWDGDWFRSAGRRWFEAGGGDDDDERVEHEERRRWHARHRHDRSAWWSRSGSTTAAGSMPRP